jgi:hypothetical protein
MPQSAYLRLERAATLLGLLPDGAELMLIGSSGIDGFTVNGSA